MTSFTAQKTYEIFRTFTYGQRHFAFSLRHWTTA